jgi:tetratricopeptide (TPR) repeat protein
MYFTDKKLKEAKICFGRAATIAPDKPAVQFGLGATLAALGEHEAAIKAFSEANRLNPGQPSTVICIANSYEALGRPQEALQALHNALRRNRRSAPLHKKIGDIYVSLGRYSEAVEEYRASVLNRREGPPPSAELTAALEAGGSPETVAKRVQEIMTAESRERRADRGGQRAGRFARRMGMGLGNRVRPPAR